MNSKISTETFLPNCPTFNIEFKNNNAIKITSKNLNLNNKEIEQFPHVVLTTVSDGKITLPAKIKNNSNTNNKYIIFELFPGAEIIQEENKCVCPAMVCPEKPCACPMCEKKMFSSTSLLIITILSILLIISLIFAFKKNNQPQIQ